MYDTKTGGQTYLFDTKEPTFIAHASAGPRAQAEAGAVADKGTENSFQSL